MPARHHVFLAAVAGAALLLAGASESFAQSTGKPASATAKKKRSAATAKTRARSGSDYWTVNANLPTQFGDGNGAGGRAATLSQPVRTEINSEFGRVPLQTGSGSIGLASGSVVANEFRDGRQVPGITANTHSPSSYVGLSLTVRPDNKSFPVPTPWSPPQW